MITINVNTNVQSTVDFCDQQASHFLLTPSGGTYGLYTTRSLSDAIAFVDNLSANKISTTVKVEPTELTLTFEPYDNVEGNKDLLDALTSALPDASRINLANCLDFGAIQVSTLREARAVYATLKENATILNLQGGPDNGPVLTFTTPLYGVAGNNTYIFSIKRLRELFDFCSLKDAKNGIEEGQIPTASPERATMLIENLKGFLPDIHIASSEGGNDEADKADKADKVTPVGVVAANSLPRCYRDALASLLGSLSEYSGMTNTVTFKKSQPDEVISSTLMGWRSIGYAVTGYKTKA
jgi:hypothetical protein